MTTTVDFDALQAAQGPRVVLMPSTFVGPTVTGVDYADFSDFASVYVTAKASVHGGPRPNASLTVTVQHSDDGSSWSTAATLTLTNDGSQSSLVSAPKAHLRAVAVGAHSEWQVLVTAAPTYLDPPASESGGSQHTIYTGDGPIDGVGTIFALQENEPSTSGTFTLTFRGETTDPITFDALSQDIAIALDALAAVAGCVSVVDGYEDLTLDQYQLRFVFTGALLGETEDPTVTNDLTDNGVTVGDISTGSAGDPVAPALDDLYVAGSSAFVYVFDGGAWNITRVAAAAISTVELADLAVTTGKLAAAAVTSDQIATGGVAGSNIADGAITTLKMGRPVGNVAHGATVNDLIDALILGKVMAAP